MPDQQSNDFLSALDQAFRDYLVSPIDAVIFFDLAFWDDAGANAIQLPANQVEQIQHLLVPPNGHPGSLSSPITIPPIRPRLPGLMVADRRRLAFIGFHLRPLHALYRILEV